MRPQEQRRENKTPLLLLPHRGGVERERERGGKGGRDKREGRRANDKISNVTARETERES